MGEYYYATQGEEFMRPSLHVPTVTTLLLIVVPITQFTPVSDLVSVQN
jgi:hypothetical protein